MSRCLKSGISFAAFGVFVQQRIVRRVILGKQAAAQLAKAWQHYVM